MIDLKEISSDPDVRALQLEALKSEIAFRNAEAAEKGHGIFANPTAVVALAGVLASIIGVIAGSIVNYLSNVPRNEIELRRINIEERRIAKDDRQSELRLLEEIITAANGDERRYISMLEMALAAGYITDESRRVALRNYLEEKKRLQSNDSGVSPK